MNDTVRVLIFNEEGSWVAQCLEHDVCVQAESLDALQRRFQDAMILEDDVESIEAAPPEFFAKWEAARELGGAPDNTEMRLAA